jgi:hypothetical protein
MILPNSLLPEKLGLKWGITREQALTQLGISPPNSSTAFLTVRLAVQEEEHDVHMLFDEHAQLYRLEVDIDTSRDFWGEYSLEEFRATRLAYRDRYQRMVEICILTLGPPDFSGEWGSAGYPEDQTASLISYWSYDSGRMQVEYDHPDKEFPIVIRMSCYAVNIDVHPT